jgi:hypothetical protein
VRELGYKRGDLQTWIGTPGRFVVVRFLGISTDLAAGPQGGCARGDDHGDRDSGEGEQCAGGANGRQEKPTGERAEGCCAGGDQVHRCVGLSPSKPFYLRQRIADTSACLTSLGTARDVLSDDATRATGQSHADCGAAVVVRLGRIG